MNEHLIVIGVTLTALYATFYIGELVEILAHYQKARKQNQTPLLASNILTLSGMSITRIAVSWLGVYVLHVSGISVTTTIASAISVVLINLTALYTSWGVGLIALKYVTKRHSKDANIRE